MATTGANSSLSLDYVFDETENFARLTPEQSAEMLFRIGEYLAAEDRTLSYIVRDYGATNDSGSYQQLFASFVENSGDDALINRMRTVRTLSVVSGSGARLGDAEFCEHHLMQNKTPMGGLYIGIDKEQNACWFWGEWCDCFSKTPTSWVELDRDSMASILANPMLGRDHAAWAAYKLKAAYDNEIKSLHHRLERIEKGAKWLNERYGRAIGVSREILS